MPFQSTGRLWATHPLAPLLTSMLYSSLNRETALIDTLSEVSNPEHLRHVLLTNLPPVPSFVCATAPFQIFLSEEQIDELVRPSPDTIELVCAWLAHQGIRFSSISRTHGGIWLTVTDLRVSQVSMISYLFPEVLHTRVQAVMLTTYISSMEVTVQTPHMRTFGIAPAKTQAASGKPGTISKLTSARIQSA